MLWAFRAAFRQHAVPSALNAQVFNARPKPQVEFLTSTSSAVKQGLPEAISSPAIPRRGNSCQKACSQRCTAIMLAANVDATNGPRRPRDFLGDVQRRGVRARLEYHHQRVFSRVWPCDKRATRLKTPIKPRGKPDPLANPRSKPRCLPYIQACREGALALKTWTCRAANT